MEENGNNDKDLSQLEQELTFRFSKSSGPGGQHTNKVSTRVELRFNVRDSKILTDEQKETITVKLKNRISKEGELRLISQKERSQIRNKQVVIERFLELISSVLAAEKVRKATKPSTSSRIKRLEEKRKLSERKQARQKPQENGIN
jgi:ribosome-associated protein